MIWRTSRRTFELSKGLLLGILNTTPDSFSDGGLHCDTASAVEAALAMSADGAAIIDVGGESTRPGATPVSAEEECRRVVPVVEELTGKHGLTVSIDTSKAEVAQAAIEAGAEIVNDVTAMTGDEQMAELVRSTGAGLILMHMQGTPRNMQENPVYSDVVEDVTKFLRQRMAAALSSGIDPDRIVLDPGIGFGKTFEHNRLLLAGTHRLCSLGRPVLIGVSRKSFLGRMVGTDQMEDRLWPGVAITSCCRREGALLFRVHDVKPHHDALRMTEAILASTT